MRGAATVGSGRPRNEYGATVVFDALFWLQSTKTLPSRTLFAIVDVTDFGEACSSCWATFFASVVAPWAPSGLGSGTYKCRPLLPLVTG